MPDRDPRTNGGPEPSIWISSPPVARLVDRGVALLAAAPELRLQEPLAQGLTRQHEAMQFRQLLGEQGRAEPLVAAPRQREGRGLDRIRVGPVAAFAAFLRHQGHGAVATLGREQAAQMPRRDPQLLTGRNLSEPTFAYTFDRGQGIQFASAHG